MRGTPHIGFGATFTEQTFHCLLFRSWMADTTNTKSNTINTTMTSTTNTSITTYTTTATTKIGTTIIER